MRVVKTGARVKSPLERRVMRRKFLRIRDARSVKVYVRAYGSLLDFTGNVRLEDFQLPSDSWAALRSDWMVLAKDFSRSVEAVQARKHHGRAIARNS